MRRLIMFAAFMSLNTCAATAADAVDCRNATSTYEMNVCADEDFSVADAALNAAYQAALTKIKGQDAPAPYDAKAYEAAFRAAQRAWVAFRNADCGGVVPFEWTGGSGTTAAVLGCMVSKTETRTKELSLSFGPQ